MMEWLNNLHPYNTAKLDLLSGNFLNFNSIHVSTFSKKAGMSLTHNKEENDTGTENIEGVLNNAKNKIRFLYCPRCGLRRPADEILGFYWGRCPSCGCRMVEEGPLPYTHKKSYQTERINRKN